MLLKKVVGLSEMKNQKGLENKSASEALDVWATDVMVWLKEAVRAGAYDLVLEYFDSIVEAFLILVRPEYRKLMAEVIREVLGCLRQR